MAHYFETRHPTGDWSPAIDHTRAHPRHEKATGVQRAHEYGHPIRGWVRVAEEHEELGLEALRGIYGGKDSDNGHR